MRDITPTIDWLSLRSRKEEAPANLR
jgi:hypothetical protein